MYMSSTAPLRPGQPEEYVGKTMDEFVSLPLGGFPDIVLSSKERVGEIKNFVKSRTTTTGMRQGFIPFPIP